MNKIAAQHGNVPRAIIAFSFPRNFLLAQKYAFVFASLTQVKRLLITSSLQGIPNGFVIDFRFVIHFRLYGGYENYLRVFLLFNAAIVPSYPVYFIYLDF